MTTAAAPPDVRLEKVVKRFDGTGGGRRNLARGPTRLVLRAARPVGLREDNDLRMIGGAD